MSFPSGTQKRGAKRPPKTTYFALVLLAAAGAGVIARYHSGQSSKAATPFVPGDTGGLRISAGETEQGPFGLRIGSALTTSTGYWPGAFLTIQYPEDPRDTGWPNRLHQKLRQVLDSPSGRESARRVAYGVISRYITVNIEPLGPDMKPCGNPCRLAMNAFFGPDAELAGVLPSTYSNLTKSMSVDVVSNDAPAVHGHWVISGFQPSAQFIENDTNRPRSLTSGPVHVDGQALELPEISPSLEASGRFAPEDDHVVSGLPGVECSVHARVRDVGSWRLVVDRILPQYIVPSPRIVGVTGSFNSIEAYPRTYPIGPGGASHAFYCFPVYPGQQKFVSVGGRVVRLTSTTKTLTFHDLDLVYDPGRDTYIAQWSSATQETVDGISFCPLNELPDRLGGFATDDLPPNTALVRLGYHYPVIDFEGSPLLPENIPEASLDDPLIPGAGTTESISPPFYLPERERGATLFRDWFNVYVPGQEPPAPLTGRRRDYAPGVHDLVHAHYRGVAFTLAIPPALAAEHKTIHLDKVDMKLTMTSDADRYPFVLTLPIVNGTDADWARLLTAPASSSMVASN